MRTTLFDQRRARLCAAILATLWLGAVPGVAPAACPPRHDVPDVADPGLSPGVFPATIVGLHRFAVENSIGSLTELLAFLPDDMRVNYAFMEDTGTDNHASVDFPRQMVFSSDSSFAMAFNTHPGYGAWEQADLMELHDDGEWEFRALRFVDGKPVLDADVSDCRRCHAATPNDPPEPDAPMVPRWGPYPIWPGAFGDDGHRDSSGVTAAQAVALNRWQTGDAPDRMASLVLKKVNYRPRFPFMLPQHRGTTGLNHINIDLAPRHAVSVYRRFQRDPDFLAHRYAYLAQVHCSRMPAWKTSGAEGIVAARAAALGVPATWDGFWSAFGIRHPTYEVDLDTLPGKPPKRWGDGFDGVQQYTDLLIFRDLVQEDPRLRATLRAIPDEPTLFSDGCFENKSQALDWLTRYNFSERSYHQALREKYVEGLRAWRGMLFETREAVCPLLIEGVAKEAPPRAAGG